MRRGWITVGCGLALLALAALMVIRGWDVDMSTGDDRHFLVFLCVGCAALALVVIGLPGAAPRRRL